MQSIVELPHSERMRIRQLLEDGGAAIACYCGAGIQVAMPREWREFVQSMRSAGLKFLDGSRHRVPLGSDHAPENLRHDSPGYPGCFGFWHYAEFVLQDQEVSAAQ